VLLLGDAHAVGHLDDEDAIEERLVILVVAERLPLGLVAVRQDDALERNRGQALGGVVVALLGGRQQRMQHLDRRLEHLDEFHHALVGAAQRTGVAVGVRIVLGVMLQLADVYLADQRGDVLVVFVTGLGLGDRDLFENGRIELDDAELGDVAVVLLQTLHRPGRHDGAQVAGRDAVVLFQDRPVLLRREQAQRRLEHRRTLDGVERDVLHQILELFRQRRLTAADRPEQIENLLLLLQPLRRMLQVRDQVLDGLLHAVELGEGGVAFDHLVLEDPAQRGSSCVSVSSGSPMAASRRSAAPA
jgi:hypothetical protein